MGITNWKVGQEVILYDSCRTASSCVWRSHVAKIGRKLVTTADGHKFDTDYEPPQEHTGYGSSPRLYSIDTWAEHTWRKEVRAEVMRLFEHSYDAATIPLETLISLSEVLLLGIPDHLKPKAEDRLDEIRNADSTDDHHRASSSK